MFQVRAHALMQRALVTRLRLTLGHIAPPAPLVDQMVFGTVSARTALGPVVTLQIGVVVVTIGVRFTWLVEDVSVASGWQRDAGHDDDQQKCGHRSEKFPH